MTAAFTCPAGHASTTDDYCDTCGAVIAPPTGLPPVPPPPSPAPAGVRCSNCGAEHVADDLFCEVCGLDFTTGRLPAPPPPPAPVAEPARAEPAKSPETPTRWTAIVEADRAFFAKNHPEAGATLTFPEGLSPREVPLAGDEVQVGRGGDADVDLDHVDPGVSHRHLRLVRHADGGGWDVIDDGSANGTWVGDADQPVSRGTPVPVGPGSRIHIGAFTTITLRDDRGDT